MLFAIRSKETNEYLRYGGGESAKEALRDACYKEWLWAKTHPGTTLSFTGEGDVTISPC